MASVFPSHACKEAAVFHPVELSVQPVQSDVKLHLIIILITHFICFYVKLLHLSKDCHNLDALVSRTLRYDGHLRLLDTSISRKSKYSEHLSRTLQYSGH